MRCGTCKQNTNVCCQTLTFVTLLAPTILSWSIFCLFFFLFSRINLWVFLCTTPFTPPTVYLFFSRLSTLSISIGPPPPPLCLSWVKSTYLSSPLATVSTTKPCLLSHLHSSLSSLSSKRFASQSLLVKLLSMQPSDSLLCCDNS